MEIVVGGTLAVKRDPAKENPVTPAEKKVFRRDQRKNRKDRRKSVREGILVYLSSKNDRRNKRKRRGNDS